MADYFTLHSSLLLTLLTAPALAQCDHQKLYPSSTPVLKYFGDSVALHADRLLVGSKQAEVGGEQRGAAWVFERVDGRWGEQALLTASDGEELDRFGRGLAIEGTTALIGAPGDDGFLGSVYVFEESGGVWTQTDKLYASDGVIVDNFGGSIVMQGDQAVISAQRHVGDSGAVYVFQRQGGTWTEVDKLVPLDSQPDWNFGAGMALDGNRLAVGALMADGATASAGAVYIFEYSSGSWSEVAKLQAAQAQAGDLFGAEIELEGDRLLTCTVVSPRAWVFERSGGSWSETAELVIDPAPVSSGFFLALQGDLGFVGVRSEDTVGFFTGRVHAFRRESTSDWRHLTGLHAPDITHVWWGFGSSLAIGGGELLVGAPWAEGAESHTGAIYTFDLGLTEIDSYCDSLPNSTGASARIDWEGSTSPSIADLVLIAEGVPDQPGLFFLGANQVQLPFGNGLRCVGGQVYRLPVEFASGGVLRHPLDFGVLPAMVIEPGSTWNFQAWFRDPAAGGSAFNLSDGLHVPFCH